MKVRVKLAKPYVKVVEAQSIHEACNMLRQSETGDVLILHAAQVIEPGTVIEIKHESEAEVQKGVYVGDVDLYAALLPDGTMALGEDPEHEPPALNGLPMGARHILVQENPKFRVGDKVCYGCQVDWRLVQNEEQSAASVELQSIGGSQPS